MRVVCLLAIALGILPPTPSSGQDIFAAPIRELPERSVQVDRLDLSVSVDPDAREVSVRMDALVRAKTPRVLQFAWPKHGLSIDSVRVDLANPDTALAMVRGDSLIFSLSAALPMRGALPVHVYYRVPWGRGVQASEDPGATDACCLWTESDWIPIPDDPSERYAATLRVQVPTHWSVLAGGTRTRNSGDWGFSLPRPVRLGDLGFAAGVFDLIAIGRVEYARPRGAVGDLSAFANLIDEPLEYFTRKTGYRLPWDTLRVALLPLAQGGATSRAGAIAAKEDWLLTGKSLPPGSLREDMAELVAKQWTQGVLAPEWWSDQWANEAMAGSMALAYLEDLQGEHAVSAGRERRLQAYLQEARNYRRPLVWDRFVDSGDLMDEHARGKGTLLLHEVRMRIGPSAWWASIRRLLARRAFSAMTSDDLLAALRPAAGPWIDAYFEAWVYGAGHPDIDFKFDYGGTDGEIIAEIEQVQEGPLVPSAFPIDTRLEWLLLGDKGSARLTSKERKSIFSASSPMAPRFVTLDPDGLMVAEYTRQPDLAELAALLRYGSPHSRLKAAERISDFSADPTAMLSLRLAYYSEESPWVRTLILKAAGAMEASDSANSLLRAGLADPDAGARVQAVRSLALLNPDGAADPLMNEVAQRDTISAVQAAAVLGVSGEGAEALARAALITPSEDAVLFAAGVEVLLREAAEARDIFLGHTTVDLPEAEVLAALRLAPVVSSSRQTRLRVLSLLSHPSVSIRRQAARAGHEILRRGNRPAVQNILANEWHPEAREDLQRLVTALAGASW
jgi:aminopeptidase N